MSDAATQHDESQSVSDSSLTALLREWYHVPVLVALMAIMLATRLRALSNFQTSGGVLFRGNDPWYHFRETTYLLENFPSTMPFDVWTNYPLGTNAEQFGTLYDQIVAGFILVTSFGDPSPEYAGLIMLIAAPVFLTLAVIPTYLIAARIAGRGPALAGVAVLGLLPGSVLTYTVVGFYDHHAAEVFFQTLGVFGFVAALAVAQREQPIWELVVDRDFSALRTSLLYSVGAGIAAAMYMWAWPPGVLLVGFSGIFFVVAITSETFHGRSPEPVAFVGAVAMSTAGLLMLIPLNTFTFGGPTSYNLLQVLLPLGVAGGCVFLAALARKWESSDYSETVYPVAVGGSLAVSLAGFAVVLPSGFSSIISSLRGTVGFSTTAGVRTIGEAQPFLSRGSPFQIIYAEYGLALFTAIFAAIFILARPLVRSDNTRDTVYVAGSLATVVAIYLVTPVFDSIAGVFGTDWQVLGLIIAGGLLVGATLRHRYDAVELYLLIWAAFITSAAFTQSRFNYYLAVVVAVFNALFIAQVFGAIDLKATGNSLQESVQSLEGWQVMVAVAAVLIITVPLLVPFAGSAWSTAERNGPGAVTQWDDTFEWMNSQTPAPGELEGADNPMEYYGTYERPPNDDYEYPEGAYGIQSWWDYGHWITVNGERIPNANPFQQGATEAANYLLAPSEQRAAEVLDERMGSNDQTRYVMVDWQMVSPNSKFGAPTVFYDDGNETTSDFIDQARPLVQTAEGQQFGPRLTLRNQRYYESQMIRLYNYHGSAVDPQPIVIETEPTSAQTRSGRQVTVQTFDQEEDIQRFGSLSEAQDYVNETPNARIGGIGANPSERVEALQHYRLVKASQSNAFNTARGYRREIAREVQATGLNIGNLVRTTPNWVKTFERVPGATVEGTGAEPGEEISAAVEMEVPENGGTFTYRQYATADENGNFEMTLPYSTTGYDEFGPEDGYTNTSVQATGAYTFSSSVSVTDDLETVQRVGQADVTEGQVVGADTSTVTVELTEETLDSPEGAQSPDASSSEDTQTSEASS